jgi:hypothetical protein
VKRVGFVLGFAIAGAFGALVVACSLNPQPLPPLTGDGSTGGLDAANAFPDTGTGGDAGMFADAVPPTGDGGGGVDGGAVDSGGDAASDDASGDGASGDGASNDGAVDDGSPSDASGDGATD